MENQRPSLRRSKSPVVRRIVFVVQVIHLLIGLGFLGLALAEFSRDPPFFDSVDTHNSSHIATFRVGRERERESGCGCFLCFVQMWYILYLYYRTSLDLLQRSDSYKTPLNYKYRVSLFSSLTSNRASEGQWIYPS